MENEKPVSMSSSLLSLTEASQLLGIHRDTIRGWVRDGKLRGTKAGAKIMVHRIDIEGILQGGQPAPGSAQPPLRPAPLNQEKPRQEEDDLLRLVAHMPADRVVELWRFSQGHPAYVASMTPGEFSLPTISHSFGPGHYLLKLFDGDREIKTATFRIASPKPSEPAPSVQPAAPQVSDPILAQTIRELAGQLAQVQPQQAPPPPPPSPPIVFQPPDQPDLAKQRREFLEEVELMKRIFKEDKSPGPSWGEILAAGGGVLGAIIGGVPKFVEAMQSVGSLVKGAEVPGDSPWERLGHSLLNSPLAAEVGKPIIEAFLKPTAAVPPPAGPAPTRVPTPVPDWEKPAPPPGREKGVTTTPPQVPRDLPAPPAPATPQTPAEASPPDGIPSLVAAALRAAAMGNDDPGLYVPLVASKIPPIYLSKIVQASREDFLAFVRDNIDLTLAMSYPGWVEEFREALLEEISAEKEGSGVA